jgi:hypothetical protein
MPFLEKRAQKRTFWEKVPKNVLFGKKYPKTLFALFRKKGPKTLFALFRKKGPKNDGILLPCNT